jgi:hypothetical protein
MNCLKYFILRYFGYGRPREVLWMMINIMGCKGWFCGPHNKINGIPFITEWNHRLNLTDTIYISYNIEGDIPNNIVDYKLKVNTHQPEIPFGFLLGVTEESKDEEVFDFSTKYGLKLYQFGSWVKELRRVYLEEKKKQHELY